jgi:hypothetical protein
MDAAKGGRHLEKDAVNETGREITPVILGALRLKPGQI